MAVWLAARGHQVRVVGIAPDAVVALYSGNMGAAACALPLVTTDVPGCREVVTHEVDGLPRFARSDERVPVIASAARQSTASALSTIDRHAALAMTNRDHGSPRPAASR
jgi:glycosyltransferase involved in cell wall biosynthesis